MWVALTLVFVTLWVGTWRCGVYAWVDGEREFGVATGEFTGNEWTTTPWRPPGMSFERYPSKPNTRFQLYQDFATWRAPVWPLVALCLVMAAIPGTFFVHIPFRNARTVRPCPSCGYDTVGLAACPECGAAMRPEGPR